MPREVVTVQVGQCGNQMGSKFWDVLLQEHLTHPEFEEARDALFYRTRDGGYKVPGGDSLCARCVAIDMEEGVLSAMVRGPIGGLFDRTHFVSDVSGAGNNWAVGNIEYGERYLEVISNSVQTMVERCDSIQTFLVMHSLSGGTGSGLGTRVVGMLKDEFPHVFRFCPVVMPSETDNVVTSPYNSCFALKELIEHSDCVIPLDNDSLTAMADRSLKREKGSTDGSRPQDDATVAPTDRAFRVAQPTKNKNLPFDSMNAIVAQMLSNLTCSMRFPGALNMDINEVTTNLVPYPSLLLLTSAIAPLSIGKSTLKGARHTDEIFAECYEGSHQLVRLPDAGKRHTTLACSFIARGADWTIGDISRNVARAKTKLNMIHWNQEGFKTSLCGVSPLGHPHSLLVLSNNCAIGEKVKTMQDKFMTLYRNKSYVHHYSTYIEEKFFDDTMECLSCVVEDYHLLNTSEPPTHVPRTMRDLVAF
ncbi:epsilon tubulin, putative [Bodo saltans]|uniref:Epsilon tubulin, putative n=1 Tax=Bodo saltans TaxID=75058 RepID=A0A0S4KPM6_BODSA|nr:epsilon tubulin, putative [Bodo saltans]|eukprot:CUI14870.1 epsilon tubulin, putative [Bodo saltans]